MLHNENFYHLAFLKKTSSLNNLCLTICRLRLIDVARQFYKGCLEMHSPGATWQKLKDEFRLRFRDTHTDQ